MPAKSENWWQTFFFSFFYPTFVVNAEVAFFITVEILHDLQNLSKSLIEFLNCKNIKWKEKDITNKHINK